MTLVDKVAVVTGAGQGIGEACALELLKQGCKVCIFEQNEVTGNQFVQNVAPPENDRVLFVKCDVTSLDNFRAAFETAISKFGRIDILVNNAGTMDERHWMRCVNVTFISVIQGINLGFEYMGKNAKGKGGHIINIASIAGYRPYELFPVYSACKHAIIGLTRSFGSDYHFNSTNVKVNGICPSAIDTPLFRIAPTLMLDEKRGEEEMGAYDPMKPSIVAEAMVKLLKDGRNGALVKVEDWKIKYFTMEVKEED